MSKKERIYQVHLHGFGHSGRGIRFRQLLPKEKRDAEASAAREAGESATNLEVRNRAFDEGIKRMLVEVTDEDVEDVKAEGVTWHKVNLQTLETHETLGYDALFTAKDVELLEGVYAELHDVNILTVKAIVGKAIADG